MYAWYRKIKSHHIFLPNTGLRLDQAVESETKYKNKKNKNINLMSLEIFQLFFFTGLRSQLGHVKSKVKSFGLKLELVL